MMQVQPLHHDCYHSPAFEVFDMPEVTAADWRAFAATMIPNTDQMRREGHYAADVRRRARGRPPKKEMTRLWSLWRAYRHSRQPVSQGKLFAIVGIYCCVFVLWLLREKYINWLSWGIFMALFAGSVFAALWGVQRGGEDAD
jgi:hypothetical protein